MRSVLAGLLAGALIGLVGAVLTVPLRRLAGVPDRSYINVINVALGSVVLWGALGAVYGFVARRARRPEAWVAVPAALIAALLILAIYTNSGPLSPYPVRCASLAVPIILIVVLGGGALFFGLLRATLPLQYAAPAGLVAAAVVAAVVAYGDKQPKVQFRLSHLPASNAAAASSARSTPGAVSALSAAGTVAPGTAAGASSLATATPQNAAQLIHFTVAGNSQAAYTVREKLAQLPAPSDAVGTTSAITGDLYLTQSGIAPSPPSTFTVDLTTLKSDAPQRDNFIKRASLQTSQFPNATYTITGIDGFPTNYQEGTQVNVTLHGTFTVHGVSQPLDWTGQAQYANGTLEAVVSTDFKMEQFNITPPVTPVATATDGVHLDLHIFLTRQPS
ncbi:MAG TPA: YceI family protein [Dehalococcoidia bacterium]|nr:YceI family protein [Dehalococcoidia bacterium]